MYFVVAAVLAAIILMPLAWTGAGYALRRYRFPVLVEPATRLDQLFLTASGQRLERVTVPAALAREPGEMALRIPLVARPYAGITIDEPSPDWTGYRSLAVDVTNPGRTPLLLEVRVHDRAHNYTYADRFNAEISVAPGRRETIEFALEAIRAAPAGRSLDLRHVANVTLFRSAPGGPREFWLHRIELR